MTKDERAKYVYQNGLSRVRNTSQPKGQKFSIGDRVFIAKDLGKYMSHFPSGEWATVMYTYAHAYGGNNIKSYCLNIDNHGKVSWYYEHQLSYDQGS